MATRAFRVAGLSLAISFATDGCSSDTGAARSEPDAAEPDATERDSSTLVDAATALGADVADAAAVPADAPEDGTESTDAPDASPATTYVRVAQLSTDAPALDFCLGVPGTAAVRGPFIAQFVGATGISSDAGAAGLSYAQVSTYFTVNAGATELYLVPAGSTSCSSDGGSDEDSGEDVGGSVDAGPGSVDAAAGGSVDAGPGSVDAAAGGSVDAGPPVVGVFPLPPLVAVAYTILVIGEVTPADGSPGMSVRLIPDGDPTAPSPASGGASLRAINAVSGAGPQDFGFGSFAGGWLPLFTGIAFGAAGSQVAPSEGVLDGNGYLPIEPFSDEPLSARASVGATSDTAVALDVSVAFESIATVLAVGTLGDAVHPPELLLCDDNAPVGGYLADCSVIR
jgi:hypothetical protein